MCLRINHKREREGAMEKTDRERRKFLGFLGGALFVILTGCTKGFKEKYLLEEKPYDWAFGGFKEREVLFVSDMSPGGYPLGRFTKRLTVYNADKKMADEGGEWAWFKLKPGQKTATENMGYDKKTKKRKRFPVLLDGDYHLKMSLPAQLIKGRKLTESDFRLMEGNLRERGVTEKEIRSIVKDFKCLAPYIKVYRVRWIGWCGNEIPPDRNLLVFDCPAIVYVHQKYAYKTWVLVAAFLAGLLGGLGLGYLFWHKTVETAVGASCSSIGPSAH